jgi:hypothetical protein
MMGKMLFANRPTFERFSGASGPSGNIPVQTIFLCQCKQKSPNCLTDTTLGHNGKFDPAEMNHYRSHFMMKFTPYP